MNRRSFFSMIGAAAVVSKAEVEAQPRRLVDVSDVNNPGFRAPTRAIVDGVDVSNRCYRAELWSDGTGTAYCHKVIRFDKRGKPAEYAIDRERCEIIREQISGCLQIIRPKFGKTGWRRRFPTYVKENHVQSEDVTALG